MSKTTILLLIGVLLLTGPQCSNYRSKSLLTDSGYGPVHDRSVSKSIRNFRYQVDELLQAPYLQPAMIGILIENIRTGEVVYSLNAHKLLMPASNMKLFTTAAATALLGPDFRYTTTLYSDGQVVDGTLNGNLFVRGSGDPTISGRYNNGLTTAIFENWADSLKTRGIRKINGAIIGDDNIFDDDRYGYSWALDDHAYYYAAEINGLSFNDNCIDLRMSPGHQVGQPATIRLFPQTDYVRITNELITVSSDSMTNIDFSRTPGTNEIRIFGTIKAGSDTIVDWATVSNPTLFFLTVFKETLNRRGIEVKAIADIDDTPIQRVDYQSMQRLAGWQSVPLSRIIFTLNKESQNSFAEHLQKTLGAVKTGRGDWKNGIQTEKNWLESIGIPKDQIFIVDGSGLSRHNLVTPFQIVRVLKAIAVHPKFEMFFQSLPVGGVDGTLKNRFRGSAVAGHVYAKTGYVGRVRTLSGYLDAQNGRRYVFSIMLNHYPVATSTINQLQDDILQRLYFLDD